MAVEQLLAQLAPDASGVAACRVDESLVDQLDDEERELVRSARPVRRAEFAAGRACAHRALATIGADVRSIGRGPRRQPAWPPGVTGSITHADGLAASMATPVSESVAAVGLDVEHVDSIDPELWPQVLTPDERAACEAATDAGAAAAVFSAKEATFKAVYPLLGVEIDFLDAQAQLGLENGTVQIPGFGVTAWVRHGRVGSLVVSVAIVSPHR
jgi:4'-phosphopantetheinyl transferase EntD